MEKNVKEKNKESKERGVKTSAGRINGKKQGGLRDIVGIGFFRFAPGALDVDVALNTAFCGILPEFLLVSDTLDGLGIEGERPFWGECSNEDDGGANTKLKAVGIRQYSTFVRSGTEKSWIAHPPTLCKL